MQGNYHAISLLAIIGLTTLLLKRFGRRPSHLLKSLVAATQVGIFFAYFLYLFFAITPRGGEGSWNPWRDDLSATFAGTPMPTHQIVVVSVCLILLVLYCIPINRPWIGLPALGCFLLIGIGAGYHFQACVRYRDTQKQALYTATPAILTRINQGRELSVQRQAQYLLTTVLASYRTRAYPAGWFSEAEFMRPAIFADKHYVLSFPFSSTTPVRILRARTRWHTWLTGLYGVEYPHADIWYPGGILKDSIGNLQLRVRE